jgi:hypothetical protein
MRSQLVERLGVQMPQIVHLPADVHSHDAAEEAIELADAYGVADGHPLDESQRFTLRAALGERADRSWAAPTVCDFEPRQNGKNDTIAARELAGLVLFGEKLIIHTAHEVPTAKESFLRLWAVFEAWDDLRRLVIRPRFANGDEGIDFKSGARIKYKARTSGAGRGFAMADLLVYDEAQHLKPEHVAASGPARLANPKSQAWYAGSGGLESSALAWRQRRRALQGDPADARFAYIEHTAERVDLVDGRPASIRPDVLDRDAWALANPAYGSRITDESLMSLYGELGPEFFARECLCVWDVEVGTDERLISAAAWDLVNSPKVSPSGRVVFGVDVHDERSSASIVAVSERREVEVVEHRDGVDWVVERVGELCEKWDTMCAYDVTGPVATLAHELGSLGRRLVSINGADMTKACGQFFDDVVESRLRVKRDKGFDTAVAGARRRFVGDAWKWVRRDSSVDITPLVAATVALWAVGVCEPKRAIDNVW